MEAAKKVIVFVEGQTELVFVRHLVSECFDLTSTSFACLELIGAQPRPVPYEYPATDPKLFLEIVNIGNDERVLAEIKRREKDLFNKGFSAIVGLRDMYSEAYEKKAGKSIVPEIIEKFIAGAKHTIREMENADRIFFFFAVMEVESWLLGMYPIFERIDGRLDLAKLNEILACDMEKIDPEKEFYHPAQQIYKLFKHVGKKYSKSLSDAEKLMSPLTKEDFERLHQRETCASFSQFYEKLLSLEEEAKEIKDK